MRLLLVEDEPEAAALLAKGLSEKAFAVDIAHDGVIACEKAEINPYDLILLDIQIPGRDGIEVCRYLRERGHAEPILLLTARGDVSDRILGLDSGADDYLTKPFDFGELLARVRALLRRGPALVSPVLTIADLNVDTRARTAARAGRAISLTSKEYALLEYLMRHQGEVVNREQISEHVWAENYDPFSNLIEVYVQRLRRKLEAWGGPRLLHTRRGEGYRLALEEETIA